MSLGAFINRTLARVGLRLVRLSQESDYDSYMISPRQVRMLREELAGVAHAFFTEHGLFGVPAVREVLALVDEFFDLYPKRPVSKNTFGSGFDNCFWIFLAARRLQPDLIVESGVQRGQSTWVLRQACPGATLHCFDVDLSHREYCDTKAHYQERDWAASDFEGVDPRRSLCFFDDHVNQARRVRQAYEKGFRRLLFDDTVPVHKIYADGEPPLPTVHMLADPRAEVGERIEWVFQGRRCSYTYRREDQHDAAALMRQCCPFPDTSHRTKYGRSSFPTFVQLVD